MVDLMSPDPSSKEWYYAFALTAFYFGRLSARDEKTYWGAVVKGQIAERRGRPNPDVISSLCSDFFARKLE
jgi:hypothetical protein